MIPDTKRVGSATVCAYLDSAGMGFLALSRHSLTIEYIL